MLSKILTLRKKLSKRILLKQRFKFILISFRDFFYHQQFVLICFRDFFNNQRVKERAKEPLAVQGPTKALERAEGRILSYGRDQLWVDRISLEWMMNPHFRNAYEVGCSDMASRYGPQHFEWRFHVLIGLAHYAKMWKGDFAELGVHEGYYARTLQEWFGGNPSEHFYYLLDSFCGLSPEHSDVDELAVSNRAYQRFSNDRFERIKEKFPLSKRFRVIQGWLPDTISQLDSDRISFLSIDLNAAQAEAESLNAIWPKLLKGCVIVLDDYGRNPKQRRVADDFALKMNEMVITLPTGQGVLFKTN